MVYVNFEKLRKQLIKCGFRSMTMTIAEFMEEILISDADVIVIPDKKDILDAFDAVKEELRKEQSTDDEICTDDSCPINYDYKEEEKE